MYKRQQYVLDPNHASLIWKLNHLGFSTFIGTFNDFEASLDFDPEDIENASLEVVISTSSLDVDIPEFEEELRGDNWFDVGVYPQAVYRTTSFLESIDDCTSEYALSKANARPNKSENKIGHMNAPPSIKY